MEKLYKINDKDNVYVLKEPVLSGELIEIDGNPIRIPYDMGRGHKLAASKIQKGEKVIKFGMKIGSATKEIQLGEHVHLNNLKSDYLPTYSKDERFDNK
ncbi:UxaA family hydrolase [Sphingobacterium sp. UBA6645]|uniref:UxaA family hydrolase n=1 Tax=Sphingobacterium sp. UBA6645 TaxID=1947511 RepID=UPI0025DB025C|nr:UxaA family hydrolase [Sphingobacterium sp. UBA6645]